MGCSLFARHYSGSRDFFPFLGLLRCFSSPAYRARPYGFRPSHARITARRFPHSDIPASQIGQHLHRAYRSRPRPSSALSAKASTVCPCSLDRKEHVCCHYGVFKVRVDRCSQRSLKTQQRGPAFISSGQPIEVDVLLGDLVYRTANCMPSTGPGASGVMAPDSLERR